MENVGKKGNQPQILFDRVNKEGLGELATREVSRLGRLERALNRELWLQRESELSQHGLDLVAQQAQIALELRRARRQARSRPTCGPRSTTLSMSSLSWTQHLLNFEGMVLNSKTLEWTPVGRLGVDDLRTHAPGQGHFRAEAGRCAVWAGTARTLNPKRAGAGPGLRSPKTDFSSSKRVTSESGNSRLKASFFARPGSGNSV